MFWGVTLESGKRYSQVVDSSYHLSMAALEPTTKETTNKFVSVMIEHGKAEFLLCTLEYERVMQVNLDLLFVEGEEVSFFLNGEGTVHLTGYVTDDMNERALAENILSEEESEEESEGSCPESDGDATASSRLMILDEEEEEDEESDWTPDKDAKKKKDMLDGKAEVIVPGSSLYPSVKHMTGTQKLNRGMNHKMILMRDKKKKGKEIESMHTVSENELVTVSSGSEVGDEDKKEEDLQDEQDGVPKRRKIKQGGDKMSKRMKQLQKSVREDSLVHDKLKSKDDASEVEIVDGSHERKAQVIEGTSQELNSEDEDDDDDDEDGEEDSSGSEEETSTAEEDSDKDEESSDDQEENILERISKGFAIKENSSSKNKLTSVNSLRKKGLKEKELIRNSPVEKKMDGTQKVMCKSLGLNASASCGGIEVVPMDSNKLKHEKGQGDLSLDQQSAKKAKKSGDKLQNSFGSANKKKEGNTNLVKMAVSQKSPVTVAKALGGVEVKDIRLGNGPIAKSGKFVHVYYIGRLSNNKVFEVLTEGSKPLSFRLGRGEVIKGWDVGIEGMRVGGKRRIIIPPALGYGNRKVGQIPPNSILHFEVELKAVS